MNRKRSALLDEIADLRILAWEGWASAVSAEQHETLWLETLLKTAADRDLLCARLEEAVTRIMALESAIDLVLGLNRALDPVNAAEIQEEPSLNLNFWHGLTVLQAVRTGAQTPKAQGPIDVD